MPRIRFKQRCAICKNNMVEMFSSRQFPICTSCHLKRISHPIPDPKFKEFFSTADSLYEKSSFLRSIKESYLRHGRLTDRQREVFQKVVHDLSKPSAKKASSPRQLLSEPEPQIDSNISLRAQRLARKAAKAARAANKIADNQHQ